MTSQETFFSFENLHRAYLDCKKRKNNKYYHQEFASNLEANLLRLAAELTNRTYRPRQSIAFIVQKPKTREIFAANFRDRVVHHLIYNYVAPLYEPRFIYDSYACRPGKGTHKAVQRVQQFTAEATHEQRQDDCNYLKMDIKSFFMSIDKQILLDILTRHIKNAEIRWLLEVVIRHDSARDVTPRLQSRRELFDLLPPDKSLFTVPPGKGLPIGNLTSQFFANVYLNELDQFVKHTLRARYYARYADDMVLIHKDKKILVEYQKQIEAYALSQLKLRFHPRKIIIRTIGSGIDFTGFIIRPEYLLVRRRVLGDCRYRLEQLADSPVKLERTRQSYRAHIGWGLKVYEAIFVAAA